MNIRFGKGKQVESVIRVLHGLHGILKETALFTCVQCLKIFQP